jgi:preprotein translocase subunit YajC
MNKKQKDSHFWDNPQYLYIIIIAAGLVLLFAGYLFGMGIYSQKSQNQELKLKNIISALTSDVVPSIVSYGKVVSINGRELVIAFNEAQIKVRVKDNARIYLLASGDQAQFDFGQIKVGDMLNVDISVDQDGNFVGESVIDFAQN